MKQDPEKDTDPRPHSLHIRAKAGLRLIHLNVTHSSPSPWVFSSKTKIFPVPSLATQTKGELSRFLQSLKIARKSQQCEEKYNAKQA